MASGRLGPTSFSLLLGSLIGLTGMGSASVAVALPDLVQDFNVPPDRGAWVIGAYAITMAVGTGLYGRAADNAGVRTPLAIGVALLSLGALLAAASPNYVSMLAARVLQGCGAGAAPVLTFAVLRLRYDGVVRSAALGNLAAAAVAGMALGPIAGGLLTESFGWRAAVAVPALALAVLALLWRSLPTGGSGARLDYVGALMVTGLSAGLMLLVQSPALGPNALGIGLVLVVVLVPLLSRRVRLRPSGFLPRSVITQPVVIKSAVGAAAIPAAWFGLLVGIPAVLAEDGWSAVGIGMALLPGAVVGAFMSRKVGRVLGAVGAAGSLSITAVASVLAALIAAVGAIGYPLLMMIAMALVYGAFALGQPAMSAAISEVVPAGLSGIALGIATLIFFLGGGTGAAVAGLGSVVGWPVALTLLAGLTSVFALGIMSNQPVSKAQRTDRHRRRFDH